MSVFTVAPLHCHYTEGFILSHRNNKKKTVSKQSEITFIKWNQYRIRTGSFFPVTIHPLNLDLYFYKDNLRRNSISFLVSSLA